MKLLLPLVLLLISASVFAAPKPKVAPQVRWEYAFVSRDLSRRIHVGTTASGVEYGSDLRLPGQPRIFLSRAQNADSQAVLLNILNRLGNQGWELVTAPTHFGSNEYIFKRRK